MPSLICPHNPFSLSISKFLFIISHFSPLTSHFSPLTSHLSPLTSHLSPLISYGIYTYSSIALLIFRITKSGRMMKMPMAMKLNHARCHG